MPTPQIRALDKAAFVSLSKSDRLRVYLLFAWSGRSRPLLGKVTRIDPKNIYSHLARDVAHQRVCYDHMTQQYHMLPAGRKAYTHLLVACLAKKGQ